MVCGMVYNRNAAMQVTMRGHVGYGYAMILTGYIGYTLWLY